MKVIQVIDAAPNCTFSLFETTDDEFAQIFPSLGQDIEFAGDLFDRLGDDSRILDAIWERPVQKRTAEGIQGTLFYGFESRRHHFPKSKRERDWDPASLNAAQRRMYATTS